MPSCRSGMPSSDWLCAVLRKRFFFAETKLEYDVCVPPAPPGRGGRSLPALGTSMCSAYRLFENRSRRFSKSRRAHALPVPAVRAEPRFVEHASAERGDGLAAQNALLVLSRLNLAG